MWIDPIVSDNITGQFLASGKWSRDRLQSDRMRGVDFYTNTQLICTLMTSAQNFKNAHGYVPNLLSPSTFSEHIYARKFFAALPMPSLADKLASREYVRARLGDDILPAVVWIGDTVDGLFEAELPFGRFILKANHGYRFNHFVNLPSDLSSKRDEIEKLSNGWLKRRFGFDWGEWQYCTFEPKLFLEEFIDFNGVQTPHDYKFFCFYGKARVIEVDVNRFTQLRSAFYTSDWTHIPVAYRHAPIQRPRPQNLDEMIRVAEAIAKGMEFARVDLYSDGKSRIRFGEITFTPGDARSRFSDPKFDLWLGTFFGKGLSHEQFQM
jgi:hypothetical protein